MLRSFEISHPLLVLALFLIGCLSSANVSAADKVDEQLARKVSFKFVDTPLEEAIYEVVGDVLVFIDRDSLTEEGVAIDEPVDKVFENVPAKQALDGILKPIGLEWSKTSDQEIQVASWFASIRPKVRFYEVSDLLASNQTSAAQFLSAMLKALQGRYREKDGDGATALLRNGLLVIWQTPDQHEEVADYLRALRLVKDLPEREFDPKPIYKSLYLDEKSRAAFAALQTPVTVSYELAPMESHLAKILKQAKLEYEVFEPEEEQIKKTLEYMKETCPFRVAEIPVITALERLLMDRGLHFTLDEGKLSISTDERNGPIPPQLFVKLDESSGWDAQSVADIVQDAVGKAQWQDIDGEGGTITQPLKDVLLIQNTIPALCQVLKVLDQLKQRPKSELVAGTTQNHSAGMGRKAADNDWDMLSDHDKIAVRLQADQLPEIDEVVCYKLKFPSKEQSEDIGKFKEVLHPFGVEGQVKLTGRDAAEIAELWRRQSFNRGAVPLLDVHLPEVGLEFRKQGRVISQTTVSWTTGTTLLKFASGKYEYYGVDLERPPGRELKDRLIHHRVFLRTYHETWHAQSAESKEATPQD